MKQRKFIASFQTSLDGFISGPQGQQDWVTNWSAALNLIGEVDLFVLGAGMYPPYGGYWQSLYEAGESGMESERDAQELAYARMASRTRHVVLSTKDKGKNWPNAELIRSLDELRTIKMEGGGNTYVVGGAKTAASLLDAGLLDEIALLVHPLILGSGTSLFHEVTRWHEVKLLRADALENGLVALRYQVNAG